MENSSEEKKTDIDAKYHKLAAEYSKIRSQATVLKKALLDEQAKSIDFREITKKQEQQIRKHDQEMESLLFRNDQLTKRISALQQEIQTNVGNKKSKIKQENVFNEPNMTVLDEELQKKIIENAQLVSSMADKEFEISEANDKISWLENKITLMEKESEEKQRKHLAEVQKVQQQKKILEKRLDTEKSSDASPSTPKALEDTSNWKEEAMRWKSECELLRSKPSSDEELVKYYETQLRTLLQSRQLAQSETKTLQAENHALNARLENLILEHTKLETQLENCKEELNTTNDNYRSQLDAMTEHLAAQNDKITKQTDEIEALHHTLKSQKKK